MMTPEEKLDEARAKEALREADEANRYFTFLEVATLAARLAREGWTPPEPVVDQDVLAFREWMTTSPLTPRPSGDPNRYDDVLCETFLAGARMAREQFAPREREMLSVLEEFSRDCDGYLDGDGHPWALLQRARDIIAKHKEKRDD
jgi:hypothetical protein